MGEMDAKMASRQVEELIEDALGAGAGARVQRYPGALMVEIEGAAALLLCPVGAFPWRVTLVLVDLEGDGAVAEAGGAITPERLRQIGAGLTWLGGWAERAVRVLNEVVP